VSVIEAFCTVLGNLEVFAKTNKKVDIPIETHNEKYYLVVTINLNILITFFCHFKI
jgi:hypothetical protein